MLLLLKLGVLLIVQPQTILDREKKAQQNVLGLYQEALLPSMMDVASTIKKQQLFCHQGFI